MRITTVVPFVLISLTGLTGLTGCGAVGSSSTPTCSEYAQMDPNTGLMSQTNADQRSAIKDILSKHDKDTGELNIQMAATQIVAYCNIYGGQAGNNKDQPIDSIEGLQGQ